MINMPFTYRIALAGLGNVGASLLNILHREADSLRTRYGVEFLLTGAAELGGGRSILTALTWHCYCKPCGQTVNR